MKTIILILTLATTGFCLATPPTDQPHISLSSYGYVEAYPDYAEINISIYKVSNNLSTSKQSVDKITKQVLSVLPRFNISNTDIESSRIYAEPVHKWRDRERVHLGEKVSRTIKITLRDLNHYPKLINSLIHADITELIDVQFKFSNIEELQDKALEIAIKDIRNKANIIASQFDRKIKNIQSISERDQYNPGHSNFMALEIASPDIKNPFIINKQKIGNEIYAIFMLE